MARQCGCGILLLAVLLGMSGCNKGDAAMFITAAQLGREYAADKRKANEKYKSKMLAVSGKVVDVQSKDSVLVFLEGDKPAEAVLCVFKEDGAKQQAAALTKQQAVTIKGKCSGRPYESKDWVALLEECQLVP